MSKLSYPDQVKQELAKAPEFVQGTMLQLHTLEELAKMGKPKTAAELQTRLDKYFNYCKENALKPGIESMALACDIDRRTFWTWCNGARGAEFQEICVRARQVLTSFIETSMYNGKINPAAAIFSLKNIARWTDTLQIETGGEKVEELKASDLPIFSIEENITEPESPTFDLKNLRSNLPTLKSEVLENEQ